MASRISKADVAKAAGVARSAVSMVLNGRPHTLAADTVERIRATASSLGYNETPAATVRCVALVAQPPESFDPSDDLYQGIVRAAVSEFGGLDYNVMTGFLEKGEDGALKLPRVLRDGGVDGFVAIATDRQGRDLLTETSVRLGARMVLVLWRGEVTETTGWVATDDWAAGVEVGEWMAKLGHRRVAIVSALCTGHTVARDRLASYREGLSLSGVEVPDGMVADGGWTRQDGARAMEELLGRGDTPPTAVICSNDWQALGAMDVAHERGLDIPGDISFVGFDGCRVAMSAASPSLATMEQDVQTIGRTAARSLVEWIEGARTGPPAEKIPARFIAGESLGPARRQSSIRRGTVRA